MLSVDFLALYVEILNLKLMHVVFPPRYSLASIIYIWFQIDGGSRR